MKVASDYDQGANEWTYDVIFFDANNIQLYETTQLLLLDPPVV